MYNWDPEKMLQEIIDTRKYVSKQVAEIYKELNKIKKNLSEGMEPTYRMRGRWMGINEVQRYLGMSRNTVKKYFEELGGKRVGGKMKFKKELVDLFVERGSNERKVF